MVVAGRYKINFESLVKWSQRKTTVKNKTEKRRIGQFVDKWKITKYTLFSSKKAVSKVVANNVTPSVPDTDNTVTPLSHTPATNQN